MNMTYKLVGVSFWILFSLIGLMCLFFDASVTWLIVPSLLYMAVTIYGSSCIEANYYTDSYCTGNSSEKIIALTFDDGPNGQYTPSVLELLAKYNATATFFVIGKNILGNEAILTKADSEGHCIGNHTFSHSYLIDFKRVLGFKHELEQTSEIVFKLIGKKMRLFRPPYGVTTSSLAKALRILNYIVVGWNIRSFDTTKASTSTISQRIQRQIKPGSIILLHDTSDKIIHVLEETLNYVKENDYKVVSLEQLLGEVAYS